MKKIILSVVVAAFAIAVQAADNAASAEKATAGACCAAKQASAEAKGVCPASEGEAKSCCSAKKSTKLASKRLHSPKASASARR